MCLILTYKDLYAIGFAKLFPNENFTILENFIYHRFIWYLDDSHLAPRETVKVMKMT